MDLLLLGLLALFAGFIDAVVGGGGLIQLPALFGIYPQLPPAVLLGTNKAASIAGTAVASTRYLRRVSLSWRALAPAVAAALLFAFLGARAVAWLPRDAVRPLILVLLVAVALYTFLRHDFGRLHAPRLSKGWEPWAGFVTGAVLGFYDGFFGPGTGSFFMFLLIRLYGFDFLHSAASARVLNVATNAGALLWFGSQLELLWLVAVLMAAANVSGALLGTGLALKHGSGFVRRIFIGVVLVLIARTAWQAYFAP